jgi:hypothetical protein
MAYFASPPAEKGQALAVEEKRSLERSHHLRCLPYQLRMTPGCKEKLK